jgi:internalin A
MLTSELEKLIEQAAREGWEELDLSGQGIEVLPPTIANCQSLKKLVLGKITEYSILKNRLQTLPIELARLTNLQSLDLSSNDIDEIPEVIGQLRNLQFLDLSNNRLSHFPDIIINLINIKTLDLRNNYIDEIPKSISRLKSLESLYLSSNKLSTFPSIIAKLSNLQLLYLSDNQLSDISSAIIIRLSNLQTLDLSSNKLSYFPNTLIELRRLQFLNLNNNNIREFPELIANLSSLQYLDLGNNGILEFPEPITKLSRLQSLDLSSNYISQIPESIIQLNSIQSLYLNNNRLKYFPESIASLNSLQFLDLGDNNLNHIPEMISCLINLKTLHLNSNSLSHFPETITELINLQSLNLGGDQSRHNHIEEIPKKISKLSNLQSLNLSFNSIRNIPEEIVQLTNLQSLDLRNNKLEHFPEVITRLYSLEFLKVQQNYITELPKAIVKLPKLSSLDLSRNPIQTPPLELARKGIIAIREYFQQLETEGVDYLYEAKLLIVGEGGAGKTSLANKIIKPDYRLREESSTKGIEVLPWSFLREDGNQFVVNIWDFGGQEIYHATHQFFLSKRSLYILVADNRKEDTDFYYWLNIVELLSHNSPILIVKNEQENRKRELPSNLRSEFRNLKDEIATNLAKDNDLAPILAACKYHLNQLPHIGDPLPKTWVKVRAALEQDARNYISYAEYLQICEVNGYTEGKYNFKLSEYFHDLGICLHFQDDRTSPLYKTVILKPKWGTDAAYAVLDNAKVIANFGRFTHEDLSQIWNSKEYREMHAELLELMQKFQLCYKIPQTQDSYIAPQLLSKTQPNYSWEDRNNLILRYTYDFMPKGIVSKFIVSMHEDIEKDSQSKQIVWRSGVIIDQKNSRAEIIENYDRREIKIRVSGKSKRDLLTVVTHELDKIHNSYKRLADKYQKLIPCNCNTCKGSQNPHFYEFANLKRRSENRKDTVECDISYERVRVLSLIEDVGERSNLYARDEDKQYNREQNNPLPVSINITNTFNPEQNMSNSQPNSNFNAPVGQVIIGTQTVAGDNIGIQNNYSPNLAQAAKEIKELLDQLSEEYNPNTEKGQNLIKDEAVKVIKENPKLQDRIFQALKEGSVTALEEAINHPVAKVVIATVKGFAEG